MLVPQYTPEIGPIDHDTTQLTLTPITSGLICQQIEEIMEDFMLDGENGYLFQTKSLIRKKKVKRNHFKDNLSIHMFRLDCDLQKILEDSQQNSEQSYESSFNDDSDPQFYEYDKCYNNSNTFMTVWGNKNLSKDSQTKDLQQQKQTTIDINNVDYSQAIERFSKNPKMEINKKIKEISSMNDEIDQQEKKLLIKKYLEKYIMEYEVFCFEQSWKELSCTLKDAVNSILAGVEETFSKKIGNLQFESRRIKLLKYLQKKKKRIWRKKVSYDCRKKVADGRLRIKGKFVTREQACEQLGVDNLDNFTAEQIKEMLQRRLDEGSIYLQSSSVCEKELRSF